MSKKYSIGHIEVEGYGVIYVKDKATLNIAELYLEIMERLIEEKEFKNKLPGDIENV